MSSKKTIQINPELFKLTNKTKKNREKKEMSINPIVSPNNLKNKLLKRIKEHKTEEIKGTKKPLTNKSDEKSYTDEFYGALDYLSDLSKKQKVNDAKRKALNSRTMKATHTLSQNINNNFGDPHVVSSNVSLELPPELQEPFVPQSSEIFNVNYKVQDDVPYGCLKNGKKRTYREWKELTNPGITDTPDIVRPPTPPKKSTNMFLQGATTIEGSKPIDTTLSREERLEQIKNKLKKLQDQETQQKQQSLDEFKKIEEAYINPAPFALEELNEFGTKEHEVEELLKEREEKKENGKIKKYLKKTVRRKFTLGKSDKLKRVSVLIKDRQTRKNIVNTQKELKKTSITDVKKYLRQHGMIKVGSTCPSDILRQTFESAVLTGEVTNTNKETLLHNFLAGEKDG